MLASNDPNKCQPSLYMKLLGPLACIALNFFKTPSPTPDMNGFIVMINYFAIFKTQGIVDQLYSEEISAQLKYYSDKMIVPLSIFLILLMYAMTAPHPTDGTGFMFFYPLYDKVWLMSLFTTGTWLWVYTINLIGAHVATYEVGPWYYFLFIAPTLWGYLCHYLWVIISTVFVIVPLFAGKDLQNNFLIVLLSLLITYVITHICILASYVILDGLWRICSGGIKAIRQSL